MAGSRRTAKGKAGTQKGSARGEIPSRKGKAPNNATRIQRTRRPNNPRPFRRNAAPNQKLHVFVVGDGEAGELGLGAGKGCFQIETPILNELLSADRVGVVQIVAGGMHVVALTHRNEVLTWGVNDQGTLGRDTTWDGGLRDVDAASDDSEESLEVDLNPKESTPTAVAGDAFPAGVRFTQVAAGDSTTFAVTEDGDVWGWGTFRNNEGILGFTPTQQIQSRPLHIKGLSSITRVACGANHALALDSSGSVFAWGSGQQNQLGRRIVERRRAQGLVPAKVGLPRGSIVDIACGDYHSFAVDNAGGVWAWGLNNYGETGITQSAGEDAAVVLQPRLVESLRSHNVVCVKGGAHHSVAVTADGDCLTWGRVDGCQIGIDPAQLNEDDVIRDERGRIRILTVPAKVTAIAQPVASVTAQSDHCIAVTRDGKAFGWGFAANNQLGLGGDEDDDHPIAALITSEAIAGMKLNGAQAGGQFGILTAAAV